MGQKVNPRGFRLGIVKGWRSRWFGNKKNFARQIGEDQKIRKYVKAKLQGAGVSKIEIERAASKVRVNIYSAKPGLIIGKKGKDIEELRAKLRSLVSVGKEERDVALNIIESRKPDMDAQLVAEGIAYQLERRVAFRRAMKEAVSRAMRAGAEGVKVSIGGRLNGADIARTEKYMEGRVPLHTLRADIDYGFAEALTTYGIIGVKVWVFKGEIYAPGDEEAAEAMQL
jgi:small subunit ribosomal protein S3